MSDSIFRINDEIIKNEKMDWGGISCALVCAIPIVAIICDTVKKVFEMKYKKENENKVDKEA